MKVSLLALVLIGCVAAVAAVAKVDETIVRILQLQEKTDFFIRLKEKGSLSGASELKSKGEKSQFVYDTLTSVAGSSQKTLLQWLEQKSIAYQSFWIINSIYIPSGDASLVQQLVVRPDVDSLFANTEYQLHLPVHIDSHIDSAQRPQQNGIFLNEWNIDIIDAPSAWAQGFDGTGITVSNIDTGARWTHEALRTSYRGNGPVAVHDYNWWDPQGVSAVPGDNNGHGTHTIGSTAGQLGIGVAPGAKWVAARGCASSSCSTLDLMSSFQFIVCPTRVDGTDPDCSQSPNVVNNSWGGGQGSQTYQELIQACRAAGTVVVFSQGNSGPSCSSANSPGDNPGTIGVGATTSDDALAQFSSRGPGVISGYQQKPEISAPGANVRSSVQSSDTAYAAYSGTSMASPHITGVVALMLQANPSLDVEDIESLILQAVNTTLAAPIGGLETCAGVHYSSYPNYHYGFGRVNANSAVSLALAKKK